MIASIEDVISFLRGFHQPLIKALPRSSTVVPEDLPKPLRMIYQEFSALVEFDGGSGRPPFAGQDSLVPVSMLKRVGNGVVFAWENQGNWSCRCALGEDDPPVFCNDDTLTGSVDKYQQVCGSLSRFLITLCLQEAVMSAPFLLSVDERSASQALTVPLRPLWLRGPYIWEEPIHSFYEIAGEDILVAEYDVDVLVASHSEAPLRFLRPNAKYQRMN